MWPRPLPGRIVIRRLGIAMFNPHIKFKMSNYSSLTSGLYYAMLSRVTLLVTFCFRQHLADVVFTSTNTGLSTSRYTSFMHAFTCRAGNECKFYALISCRKRHGADAARTMTPSEVFGRQADAIIPELTAARLRTQPVIGH